jgi:hypothetical protein
MTNPDQYRQNMEEAHRAHDVFTDSYGSIDESAIKSGDAALRNEIMLLRNDSTANALMGGVVTQKNAIELAKRIGRKPTEDEL